MTSDRQQAPEPARTEQANWWRTVLGEYPTGVTLITALDDQGEPVAMVVGTFSAVSQDPPMVGFMPNADSTTFPTIARSGRFVANVLGASHEELCRAFSRKLPNRFATGAWTTTRSGLPRLTDAVAWFDATIQQTHTAGDHAVVLADVDDFGVGDANAGLPLLYLRGGYGSFTVPSLQMDGHGFARQLKSVDVIREPVRAFAERLGVECVICGLTGSSVVVLHAANMSGGGDSATRPVGVEFPFAAPLAPSFAAWGSPETVTTWIENSRHLLGAVDRTALASLLDVTRERGYAISRGSAVVDEFSRVVSDPHTRPTDLAALWARIVKENAGKHASAPNKDTTSVQVPVFSDDGSVELVVVITGIADAVSNLGAAAFEREILALRAELSQLVARS